MASRDLAVSGKVHVLSYLYRLSKLDSVANIVVNSSFAPLLLKVRVMGVEWCCDGVAMTDAFGDVGARWWTLL